MQPCEAGSANFFIEPYGEVNPCNRFGRKILDEKMVISVAPNFMTIRESNKHSRRDMVRKCPKNCWMVGTASR
jgi:radical SAM protein with 4Fe4S-binding SPASM domain